MFLRWFKRLLGWGVALGVVGAIVYGFLPKPVGADLDRVVRGPLQVTVSEDGKTRVKHRYSISSPLAGQLLRVELEPGDRVEALKTLVARLEPDLPQVLDARVVAQAEAKVRMSELTLQKAALTEQTAQKAMLNAHSHLVRTQHLKERNASAQELLEVAELEDVQRKEEYAASKLAVDIARFELDWAKLALLEVQPKEDEQLGPTGVSPGERKPSTAKRTFDIFAPISGRVLRRFKESATPITPGTAIIEVGDPKRLELEVDVLSSDAVQIPPQAKVIIQAWGGEQPLHGIVRLVEPAAFTKVSALGVEEQRVYVIVDLIDPFENRETLGDGYRIEAQIILWEGRDVLKVPTSALFRKGPDWAVFRVINGKAQLHLVEIGHRNGLEAEVLKGLNENDTVVIHPSDMIKEGAEIVVRTQNTGPAH
ncbi:MAG: yknX 2 [Planctomycetaceae bacterium]|nr:yknX 2 [Planctomycetaceae bacterium]